MNIVEHIKGSVGYARNNKGEAAMITTFAVVGGLSAFGAAAKGVSEGLEALGITGDDNSITIEKPPEENPEDINLIPLTEGRTAYIS